MKKRFRSGMGPAEPATHAGALNPGTTAVHENRIRHFVTDSQGGVPQPTTGSPPPGEHSTTVTTSQLFEAAWAMARRDKELDRLFNAWFYEI